MCTFPPSCIVVSADCNRLQIRAPHLGITVESVSAHHDREYCEKGNGQTRVKNGLDVEKVRIRTSPLRESGSGTSWGIPKLGVGDNLEETIVQSSVIWLEIALDIDNESGCDHIEQTGLFPRETFALAPRLRWTKKKILTKINAAFKSHSYLPRRSRSCWSASRWNSL